MDHSLQRAGIRYGWDFMFLVSVDGHNTLKPCNNLKIYKVNRSTFPSLKETIKTLICFKEFIIKAANNFMIWKHIHISLWYKRISPLLWCEKKLAHYSLEEGMSNCSPKHKLLEKDLERLGKWRSFVQVAVMLDKVYCALNFH